MNSSRKTAIQSNPWWKRGSIPLVSLHPYLIWDRSIRYAKAMDWHGHLQGARINHQCYTTNVMNIDSLSETIDSLQKRQKQIVTTRGKVQKEMRILKDQFYHNRSDENYARWQDKKAAVRRENYVLLECRKTLSKTKNKRYLLQRQQNPTEGNKRDTVPSVAFPQRMDEAERMDISQLQHAVTFSGTDYGIQTMSGPCL
ncbi:uncharacterized protein BYT42DRAFT_83559 [Radiomyces spectabilis]|uniref:uncharacterized protein n=1 Tax=Radiomyces spectabilis TaxID=64574 RepID=UPI00221E58B2|nr:uncharacterized protein BYT42DRAFT_83559 [Radiomyces spectabilis]KAI8370324.1 hypothetical protein BYT42DRAFT_83559 [Radiomyces spectabilis]